MAGSMREAMLKAGLIGKTKSKSDWKASAYKNRFGDIALFEIWNVSTWPNDYWDHCALCGKTYFERITWMASGKLKCAICPMCYVHGRKYDSQNFPGLPDASRDKQNV